jgi:hypothetical protein
LIGACCVLAISRRTNLDVPIFVLVDLSSRVAEELILYRNVWHEIFEVSVPVLLGQKCACILSVSLVADAWLAKIVHADLVSCP